MGRLSAMIPDQHRIIISTFPQKTNTNTIINGEMCANLYSFTCSEYFKFCLLAYKTNKILYYYYTEQTF